MSDREGRELKQQAAEVHRRLDDLAIVPKSALPPPRWQQNLAYGLLAVLGFGTLFFNSQQAAEAARQSEENGQALSRQIEPLQEQLEILQQELAEQDAEIAERDAQLADYDIVVAQAVAGIHALCDQVEAAGQQCARVELNADLGPPSRPEGG